MQNHTDRGAVLKSSFFKGKTALTEKAKGSTAEIPQSFCRKGLGGLVYGRTCHVLSRKWSAIRKNTAKKVFFMTVLYARSFLFF